VGKGLYNPKETGIVRLIYYLGNEIVISSWFPTLLHLFKFDCTLIVINRPKLKQ